MNDKTAKRSAIVEVGDQIGGRYLIESVVGRGAMGQVFRAHDPLVDRAVAIKVLNAGGMGSEGRGSLMNEAKSAGALSNTNVVSVYDVGTIESDGASPYIVMEFVEGESLHNYTISDIEELVGIAKGIANGLAHAHANGIIHRDLKPENIVVSSDGVPKLTDFGLARSMSSRLSMDGTLSGTVFYMAPEVALAQPVDARTDLYALGVVLYEKATGELPFFDPDPLAVISQHIHAPVVPPAARNEGIPPGLNSLIIDLMAKDPEERPQSATEVVERLENYDKIGVSLDVSAEVAVLERIARGRHVGREKELTDAKSAWREAVAGVGSTLLVTGEPGIGKSRFLRELQTLSEISGARYLLGEAYEEGGASYAPITQIIRSLIPWIKENREIVSDYVVGDLLSVSTSVAAAFPEMEVPTYDDGQSKQQRLFDGVLSLLTIFSERQPILLALEDVHWADHGSLAMMRHLARNLRNSRVLIVATYRELELDRQKPFSKVLTELNRARLARRLKLRRFDVASTKSLLEAMFLQSVSDAFTEAIFDDTEGNPFFIEEVCKGLIESGELYYEDGRWQRPEIGSFSVPQSVRMAIQDRVDQLPVEVQESLRLAAFIGRSFDYELLRKLIELDEATLIEHLEFAENSQLIEPLEDDLSIVFRFNHALVPGTLRESVSVLRRRLIHRRLAETLETSGSEEFERIATHFGHGAVRGKQFDYLLKGGQVANEGAAYDDADSLVREALEIASESGDARGVMISNELLAQIHSSSGKQTAVLDALPAAVAAWNEIPEAERIREEGLRVLAYAAEARRWGYPVKGTIAFANSVLEMLPAVGEDEIRSRMHVARSFGQYWLTAEADVDIEGAIRDGNTALKLAEEIGDPDLISGALDALQGARWVDGHVEEAYQILEKRMALLDQLDMRESTDVYGVAIPHLTELGRFAEAELFVEKLDALPYTRTPRNQILLLYARRALYSEWGDVARLVKVIENGIEQMASDQLRYGSSSGSKHVLAGLLADRDLVGELAGAPIYDRSALQKQGVDLDVPEPELVDKFWRIMSVEPHVRILCELGRIEEASDLISAYEEQDKAEYPTSASDSFELAHSVLGAYLGDIGVMEHLDQILDGERVIGQTKPYKADALWLKGELLFRLERAEDAIQELDQAIELFDEMGVLFKNGIAQRTRSQVLLELGRQEEAKSDFTRAIELLEESGAKFSVDAAKKLGSQLGLIG